MRGIACAVLVLLSATASHLPLFGQPVAPEAALEDFVQHVARLWAAGDVNGLVELLPERNPLLLDTGAGIESADSRHAAAALRALFSDHATVDARVVNTTVADLWPPRGFGELSWTYSARGAPGEQSRSVYVAAGRDGQTWSITELRLLP